jgi:hypothetical protein
MVGEIPPGMHVLHHCDNPPCINPSHLFLGTQADNMRDKEQKGRGNHPQGERHGRAKLTEADVLMIRASALSNGALARQLGVTKKTVRRARDGRAWRHLSNP